MTRRRHADDGFTLVEVIAAVALMAIAFAAILGGMAMFVRAQRAQSIRADLDTKVRTAAEAVLAAPYVSCASSYSISVPSGYTAAAKVSYWDGNMGPAGFTNTCTTDNGLQQVSVTITYTSTGAADTLTVGKKQP